MDPKSSTTKPRKMHRLRSLIHKDRMSGTEGAPTTEPPKPKSAKQPSSKPSSKPSTPQPSIQQRQTQVQQQPAAIKPSTHEDKRNVYMEMFHNIRHANMMNLKQTPELAAAVAPAEVPDFIDFSQDDMFNTNPPPFHQFNPSAVPFVPQAPFNTTNPNSVGFQHPPFSSAQSSSFIPQSSLYVAGGLYQPQYDMQQFEPSGPRFVNDYNVPLHPYYTTAAPPPQPQFYQQQPSPQPVYKPMHEEVWRPTPFTQASPANPTPMSNLKRSRDVPQAAAAHLSPRSEIERFRQAFPGGEPSRLQKAGPPASASAPLAITFRPTYELPADFTPDPSPNAPVYVSPRQKRGSPKQARSSPQPARSSPLAQASSPLARQSKRRNSRSSPREQHRRPSQQWVPKQQQPASPLVNHVASPVIESSPIVTPAPALPIEAPIVPRVESLLNQEEQAVPSPISQRIYNPSPVATRPSFLSAGASPALTEASFVSSPIAFKNLQQSPVVPKADFVDSPVSMRPDHAGETLDLTSPDLQQQTFSSPQLGNAWSDVPLPALDDLPPPSSLPAPPTPKIHSELEAPLLRESADLPEPASPSSDLVVADVAASLPDLENAREPLSVEEPTADAAVPSVKIETDSQGTFVDENSKPAVSLLLSDIRKGAHLRHIDSEHSEAEHTTAIADKGANKDVLKKSIASAIASRRTFIEEDEDDDTESWNEW